MPNTSRTKILVLLAAHNGKHWIHEQINSILNQVDVAVALIIRDDQSSDRTLEELQKHAADTRITITVAHKASGSAAQNFFSMIRDRPADGFDMVALSDQDDIWQRDKLARASRMLARTGADGYSSATIALWPNGRTRVIALNARQNSSDFLFEGAGQGCTFVITRTLYEDIRQYLIRNPNLTAKIHYHDWAIYAMARAWQKYWIFDPLPTMYYRQHEHNDTGARGSLAAAVDRFAKIRSGWYARQIANITHLCVSAAPQDPRLAAWNALYTQVHGPRRTVGLLRFCLLAGRRRFRDNLALLSAVLLGWL